MSKICDVLMNLTSILSNVETAEKDQSNRQETRYITDQLSLFNLSGGVQYDYPVRHSFDPNARNAQLVSPKNLALYSPTRASVFFFFFFLSLRSNISKRDFVCLADQCFSLTSRCLLSADALLSQFDPSTHSQLTLAKFCRTHTRTLCPASLPRLSDKHATERQRKCLSSSAEMRFAEKSFVQISDDVHGQDPCLSLDFRRQFRPASTRDSD